MKRRLTRAYDHMTMPDHCSNAIERKMVEELEYRKTGRSVRAMAPSPARRHGWGLGVAAVCLMLVLSVGGTILFLHTSEAAANTPRDVVTTVYQTVPGDYSLVTDLPAEEVEDFAAEVRQSILEEDWEAFSKKVSYPIAVWNKNIGNDGGLVSLTIHNDVKESFLNQIRMESCNQMFCNWQGICMADGRIWINEVDGQLKVTAINDMFGDLVSPVDSQYVEMEEANLAFLELLHGKRGFSRRETEAPMTIERYCEMQTAAIGRTVTVPYFTMADMDRDGINELILWVSIEGDGLEDYLILRYDSHDNEEGGRVYAFMEPQQKITGLKKDGAFYSRSEGGGRIRESGSGRHIEDRDYTDKAAADWHVWPCVRPELVAQSYEYAGTAQTRLPGNGYYIFEGLAKGTTDNDWNRLKEDLTVMGMICLEDEGTVSVFDPDAPGTCLYGTLTNANGTVQLADVGYYICTEEKEYAAEIRELLSGNPEYWISAHLPALGQMGRRVFTTEELMDYFA